MSEVPRRVEVSGGTAVTLEWEDGTETVLSARRLRQACMCAGCREHAGAAAAALGGPEPVTITGAELVGGYALRFSFGPDGHSTGIYPFGVLRRLEEL